jgi:hypothetical protein
VATLDYQGASDEDDAQVEQVAEPVAAEAPEMAKPRRSRKKAQVATA